MKSESFKEPLFAIVLKALAIIFGIVSLLVGVGIFMAKSPAPDASAVEILAAANEARSTVNLTVTYGVAGAALWWMGEVIALLARIAANGGVVVPPPRETERKKPVAPTVPKSKDRDDDSGIPKYSL